MDNAPVLLTVRQFSEKHPAFSEGGIRWLVFQHKPSLLEGRALMKLGRRVLINESAFFDWLTQQQS